MPLEPPAQTWAFPPPRPGDDLVGVGADLEPGTLLAAYRSGLFPMPIGEGDEGFVLGWWFPEKRGILPLDALKVGRSLARSRRRFLTSVDTAFEEVVDACADARRAQGWITPEIREAYGELHRLGWAHSVETWSLEDGSLVGGLYGVAIGGLFAGESMFHRATDASKVALVALVDLLRDGGASLLDVQWLTPHLASLGAVEVDRDGYRELLAEALERPLPVTFGGR